MSDFTQLTRPEQSQVKIDPTPKDCPSEGFNYPTFRLLNKQGRVKLSPKPLSPQPSTSYRLFATANSKGWFCAVTLGNSSSLVFSPLDELRSAFKSAKEDNQEAFTPKRTLSVPSGKPTLITFACNDTRLFVGLGEGQILVYDTSVLFSPGSQDIAPLHGLDSQFGPLRQILSNPGVEPGLFDIVAVVRENGVVQLLNTQLEPQGGWASADSELTPVAVAWSPKGKHLAIGLRSGDILTFALTNKTSPHKHIPPTAAAPLVSLNWLTPGHTFRTSYAPPVSNASDPTHHIICLDVKSSTATYYAPIHPYHIPDRSSQQAFTVTLAKWDDDGSGSDSKNLLVVGDKSSVDLEVLGNNSNQWHQQSQENPLTLPLDSAMDDTVLVSLEVDLTDSANGAPIMYAYLNDGTMQGWFVEHSKPYSGIVTAQSSISPTPSTFSQPVASPFSQTSPSTSTFGQPAPTSAFGQPATSAFGQSASTSAFGQPAPTSAFGQTAAPAFGQSSFGQSSAFGKQSSGPVFGSSGFGQQPSAFGQSSQLGSTSAFGQSSPQSAFSSSGQSSAFGSTSLSPFGQAAQSGSGSVFGQPASAFSSSPAKTSVFGGGSSTGAFGSSSSTTSAFGAGSSTGAFGGLGGSFGATNAFGQASFGFGGSAPPAQAAAPDMSREASMSDSTPASFGGLSLGLGESNADGKPAKAGIFGSLPSPLPAPTSTSAFGSPIKPATGFGAFSNLPTTASTSTTSSEQSKPAATSAFGSATTPQTSPAFGQSSFGQSSFGKPAFGQSAFGQSSFAKPAIPAAATTASGGGFGAFASAPTSFGTAAAMQQGGGGSTGSAFGSGAPASTTNLQVGSGFGAFASSSSPFGGAPQQQQTELGAKATSPFGGSSAFGVQPSFREASPFGKAEPSQKTPAMPFAIPRSSSPPNLSPSVKPSLNLDETDSPPATPPPKAVNVGSSSGAFGNITTSPSAFKPATGFGAFGSDTTPTSSPFFKATEAKTPPVSAFSKAISSTPPGPPTTSSSPAFGSTSLLGGPKSPFAPSTPSSPTLTKTPTTGGFGAFSGSSTGFGAFSGPKKSFGELLKTGDTTDPVKPQSSSTTTTDVSDKVKAPISVFASLPSRVPETPQASSVAKAQEEKHVTSTQDRPSAFPPVKDATPAVVKPLEKQETHVNISEDPSYSNSSLLSEGSSFVEISNEESSNENGGEDVGSAEDDAEGDEHSSTDDNSFLSSSEGSDESDEGSDDDEGESSGSASPEPTAVPLPASRSPSATPQPEIPAIRITPSPSLSEAPESPQQSLPTIKEESTTPPGTPTKDSSSYPSKNGGSPASSPVAAASPFALGLGRPSTRPTRSSPLASTPVSHEDDEETDKAKTSIPTATKPPVSPQPRFAVLPMPPDSPTKASPGETKPSSSKTSTRPQTPPLSVLGTANPATPADTPSTTPQPTKVKTPPAPSSPFGTPPATFSLFGSPAPAPSSVFGIVPNAANKEVFGAFSPPVPPAAPKTGFFGAKPIPTTPSPSAPGYPTQAAPPVKSPEVKVEEGMQRECAMLYNGLSREFETLSLMAQEASKKRMELGKSAGGSRQKADLGDLAKWGIGDALQFGQVLRRYEEDLVALKEIRDKQSRALRSLQTNMLKANTRREEISRFNKAKDDIDFAKMLKSRTLGPEHLETQTQLRRNIRAMRDRIQKLEDHLKTSKKRLAQLSSGKPGLRAPSLDTINRTYRNIDIAIQQQSDDVAHLVSRVSKLNIEDPALKGRAPSRDARLPDLVSRRPYNVTPHVAITTAAALNAEQSAHKLKRALLSVRKEPLLNTKAAAAKPPPAIFNTPQKRNSSSSDFGFTTPIKGSLFPVTPESTSPTPLPDWTLPEDKFNPSPPPSARRGAGVGVKKHQSVPLKRTGAATSPLAPPAFSWGPLPTFNPASTTMVETVKLTPPGPTANTSSPPVTSWFGGGFTKKT